MDHTRRNAPSRANPLLERLRGVTWRTRTAEFAGRAGNDVPKVRRPAQHYAAGRIG